MRLIKASTASLVVCDFELLQNVTCLTFRYPPSVRLSHAMAKNKAVVVDEETVMFRSSTVMKVTSNSLGLNLGTLLSVPRIYEI